MSALLAAVAEVLENHGARYAVIGAAALAARGVSRSTFDLDLLTTDRTVLRRQLWSDIHAAGAIVDVRTGDADDPLAGVVRISRPPDRPVDLIVADGVWQNRILAESERLTINGVDIPVINEVGIILLKLYAGGPQDLWDIAQLLGVIPHPDDVKRTVEDRLDTMPADCRSRWQRVVTK
jgi:predicted nucleotidyltransferase